MRTPPLGCSLDGAARRIVSFAFENSTQVRLIGPSRAGNSRIPSTLDHRKPSLLGIGRLGSRNARSQASDDAGNRAATRSWSSRTSARFRVVARRISRPWTVHPAPTSRRTAATLSAKPRIASPPSVSKSSISTTAISRLLGRSSSMSIERERRAAGSIARSGRADHPPGLAVATTSCCRRRCSRSRGRSAPGVASRNAASCAPTAAAHAVGVSSDAVVPPPRSTRLQKRLGHAGPFSRLDLLQPTG